MKDLLFVGNIDETEVGRLHEGMHMDLLVGALNDRNFSAILEYISPKGTETNGAMMFEIKGAATISDSVVMRSGYSANAKIILEERRAVLTLPEYALEWEGSKRFVHVYTDTVEQKTERREVQTGISDGINIEITAGLQLGDKVRGNQKMKDNEKDPITDSNTMYIM